MTFKLKHIASRFLLQIIFTLFVIGFFLFVFLFSSKRKEGALKATKIVGAITNQIAFVNEASGNASTIHMNNADFVSTKADEILEESQILSNSLTTEIQKLSDIHFLRNYFSQSKIGDSLLFTIKTGASSYKQYVLSLKELGNQYGGKVHNALVPVNALADLLSEAPDNGEQYRVLKGLTSDFLTKYSMGTIEKLISFCNGVSGNFNTYPDFDYSQIEHFALTSTKNLQDCKGIILRIRNEVDETGQIYDLQRATNELATASQKLIIEIENQINSYYKWWNWLFIVSTIIFSAIYAIFLVWFSSRIIRNIRNIDSNSKILLSGDTKREIDTSGDFEFQGINIDLQNIQSYIDERSFFVEQLLENSFSSDIKLKSKNDNLSTHLKALKARMIREMEVQKSQNVENKIRTYINEGLAKFADIMRDNSNDTIALGDNLIKELVKYLGALQGGLFLTSEDAEAELNLVSAFAFDRKKYLNKTLKKGEGLVGTCAIEGKTINITEVPKDYVAIKSGLGDTPPNNILIIPVKHEETLVGVLELASLKILNSHEIELAEQIASNLASTIITVRNNTKTAQLLEKSQQQAAEMREQEEEMRQNMEELKATQEESTRREDEMKGIIDAVGSGFHLIEYSNEGLIENINSSLSSFLEQPIESIIGSSHQSVFSSDSLINTDVLNEVIETKNSRKITETLAWGSKELKYNHTLSPILTRNGEVVKILNLLTIEDIEKE